jgi:hypothetical protein
LADTPCHGDVFHIQKQCESLANVLAQVAMGATSRRKALDVKMDAAKENSRGNTLSTPLMLARQTEQQACQLARDVKTLVHWLAGLPTLLYALVAVDRLLLPDPPELRVVAAFGIGFVALLAVLRLALGPSAAVPPRHFPFEQ